MAVEQFLADQSHANGSKRCDAADPDTLDILWGAAEIAKFIRRTRPQIYPLLESGAIPADKIGGTWIGFRSKIRQHLLGKQKA